MLKNAEDRFKDEHSRDGSGTVTRVSKQREERTVVLRYTGAGTAYSPILKLKQGVMLMLLTHQLIFKII